VSNAARLLVVSRDAAFIDELRARLSALDVVALTEATTRHALLVESPILDDVALAVLDGTVSGQVRLRLYDRLRPPGSAAAASIIFARSGFEASRSEGSRGVDLYLPTEATAREIAWWCAALLRLPSTRAQRRVVTDLDHLTALASNDVEPTGAGAGGYGWVARAGLWGVAAALTALTFWPPAERSAIGESIRLQVRSLFGVQRAFADTPVLADPATGQTRR
jgi:hypothetical protein